MTDYRYDAKLVRVVDGDTVDLSVDLGFRVWAYPRFRLLGIDTPEKVGRTKAMGLAATAYVDRMLRNGSELEVLSLGEPDKYGGRWDGLVSLRMGKDEPRIDLCEHLVRFGYAMPYGGTGERPAWDPAIPYPLPPELRWRHPVTGAPWTL